MNRRSFLTTGTGLALTINSTIAGSIGALLQPKEPGSLCKPTPSMSRYEFDRLVQTSLEGLALREEYAGTDTAQSQEGVAPLQMASAAWARLGEENVSEVAGNAYEWASRYQVSYDRASEAQGEEFDCNDRARHACEKFHEGGVPTYLLSIWPANPNERMHHDWHQMAVCKLNDGFYFVVDNEEGVFWHGTLQEFMAAYSKRSAVPMEVIPYLGISEFVEPRYDVVPAKFLMQFVHARDEEEMKSLQIPPPYPSNAQFAANVR